METKQQIHPGRKKGYNLSEESKKKISQNNAWRSNVVTPEGEFHSLSEAARHHKISPMLVTYRCKIGAEQRANGHDNTTSSKRDYRGWFKSAMMRNDVRPRAVRVPWGEYLSISSAAKAGNTSVTVIRHHIKHGKDGYEYI
jgi:hypothetical protein